jgi:hypothetical protein
VTPGSRPDRAAQAQLPDDPRAGPRGVCALLFVRCGQTPTANRLYQLVRRGSMGTPAAVPGACRAALREKSRVRIGHPDLPADLPADLCGWPGNGSRARS